MGIGPVGIGPVGIGPAGIGRWGLARGFSGVFLGAFPGRFSRRRPRELFPAHSEAFCRGATRSGIVGEVSGGAGREKDFVGQTKAVQYGEDKADRRYGEAVERNKRKRSNGR